MGRKLQYHYKENHKRTEEQQVPSHRFLCFKRREFTFPLQQLGHQGSPFKGRGSLGDLSNASHTSSRICPRQDHQSSSWTPRGQQHRQGRMFALITASVCYLYTSPKVAQITHPSGIIHSKGLFHPSQQNEEIQLQPLTGPAYCYL